jgi:hypothetical protein
VPMLMFVEAGARGRAGRPAEGLPLVEFAIERLGGPDSPAMLMPELCVLRGDLLVVSGATDDGTASWRQALAGARRLEARMPELRALTRLVGAAAGDEREVLAGELRTVHATFTEGFDTADLREAQAALE